MCIPPGRFVCSRLLLFKWNYYLRGKSNLIQSEGWAFFQILEIEVENYNLISTWGWAFIQDGRFFKRLRCFLHLVLGGFTVKL